MKVTASLVCLLMLGIGGLAQASEYIPTAGKWPTLGDLDDQPMTVRSAQYLLKAAGYNLAVDGRYGEQTANQVRRFKLHRGIESEGGFNFIDARTWENLIPNLQFGAKGWAVRALQNVLRAHGYGVAIDGVFGRQTEQAVRLFQEKRDLTQGIIPPEVAEHFTWCELVGGSCYKGGAS